MDIAGSNIVKRPYVIARIIGDAGRGGLPCRALEETVKGAVGLRPGLSP